MDQLLQKQYHSLAFRDGTGQDQRSLKALAPDYVKVDERTERDWLEYAHKLARELRFVSAAHILQAPEPHVAVPDWGQFLEGLTTELQKGSTEEEREFYWQNWLSDLLAFIENPESFKPDKEKFARLSRPHLALFLGYLHIMGNVKNHLNGLGKRHIDFYYREVLGMTRKAAIPDQAQVVFEVAPEEDQVRLPAGTLLEAGVDEEGVQLVYATDKEVVLNHATVSDIKTLYVERDFIDVQEARLRNQDDSDSGFLKMMEHALGEGAPGNPLPELPEGFEKLDDLYHFLNSETGNGGDDTGNVALQYIEEKLFMSRGDFERVMELKFDDDDPDLEVEESDWETIYPILERAFGVREQDYRKNALRKEVTDATDAFLGFNAMIRQALGEPLAGDPLPPFGGREGDVDDVLEVLNGTNPARNTPQWLSLATTYLTESLFMNEANFRLVMQVRGSKDILTNPDFETVVGLVEQAEKAKRNIGLLKPLRQEWINIYRTNDARSVAAVADPDVPFTTPGWRSFGEPQSSRKVKTAEPAGIGFVVSSPALEMSEGQRAVSLTFDLNENSYNRTELGKVLAPIDEAGNPQELPFECYFTTTDGWFAASKVNAMAGVYIMGERNRPLFATVDDKGELVTLTAGLELEEQTNVFEFELDHEGRYLLFEDGSIYRIIRHENNTTVEVELAATTQPRSGSWMLRPNQLVEVDGPLNDGGKEEFTDASSGLPLVINVLLRTNEEGGSDLVIQRIDGGRFVPADTHNYVVREDGTVYRIIEVLSDTEARVESDLNRVRYPAVFLLQETDIYFHGLRFDIRLTSSDLPVVAAQAPLAGFNQTPEWPLLRLMLKDQLSDIKGIQVAYSPYPNFENLEMERLHVDVDVRGLVNLDLYAEDTTVTPKKPFNPFGFEANTGARLLFWHRELIGKRMDDFGLSFDWLEVPAQLSDYYANYWKVEQNNADLPKDEWRVQDNRHFVANLSLYDQNIFLELGELPLFYDADAARLNVQEVRELPELLAENYPTYRYATHRNFDQDDEVLERDRFFQLELTNTSFFARDYDRLTTLQSILGDPTATDETGHIDVGSLLLETPYQPNLKSFQASYRTHFDMELKNGRMAEVGGDENARIYHYLPFGYLDLTTAPYDANNLSATDSRNIRMLLPQFDFQGEFFLGLSQLQAPQILSLLFRVSEGTASADLAPPTIKWSYLANNQWKEISGAKILSDGTNGLLNTGIMEISIPEAINDDNAIMPSGLHWVKAGVNENAQGVSHMVDVKAQAVNATFTDQENALSHLENPLPAGSITGTNEGLPEISTVTQPYPSQKGKPSETESNFYQRVSERLRHKNRALTIWDYERLVLERFPDIFKVKCLPGELTKQWDQLGTVMVIVIPNIRGLSAVQGGTPKVSADQISRIKRFLEGLMPPYAELTVKNPTYVLVKAGFAVRFNDGYSASYYESVLQEDLQKFLSPWAFEEGADIILGGNIYANVLVNYMAELPYVDYIAQMKLYQSYDGITFTEAESLNDLQNAVTVRNPDEILVSATDHKIDIISDRGYLEDGVGGVNYMEIGFDFVVRPDPVFTETTDDDAADDTGTEYETGEEPADS